MSVLFEKRDRTRVLLTGATEEERVEILGNLLRSDEPESVYAALLVLKDYGPEVVRALSETVAGLLPSRLQVLCTNSGMGSHAPVADAAYRVLKKMDPGDLPREALTRVLELGTLSIELPEACYDQGAYIGDYATYTFRPAEFARKLLYPASR
jgi:hypothetical protein